MLFIVLTGVLVGGCAGPDAIGPPTEQSLFADVVASAGSLIASPEVTPLGLIDDAIERLVPALGPAGAALGAPLRQLRDGGRIDAKLIAAMQRQLTGLTQNLPPETAADAGALEITFDALRGFAGT
ncbi:MAG TPA: hypothetical protein VMM79_18940 [Longimicrobiales bacterium]|nr:hypothetical protein [Longimicrobiales bacterium]